MSARLLLLVGLLLLPGLAWADPLSAVYILANYIGYSAAVAVVGFAVTYGSTIAFLAATVYGTVTARSKARRAQAAARAAYNANLSDRSVTALSADPPHRTIYGRCETGGDVVAIFTTDKTKADGSVKPDGYKHLVIVWSARECEQIHDIKIDGVSIGELDANGNASGADFANPAAQQISLEQTNGSARSLTLPGVASVVTVSLIGDGSSILVPAGGANGYSLSGSTLTLPDVLMINEGGATWTPDNSQQWIVEYLMDPDLVYASNAISADATLSIVHHLGDANQAADARLMQLAPAQWTANHRLRGRCYSVVTLDLERSQFQGGPPGITADISGALVLDRRSGLTAWSANPALCTDDWLRSATGFGVAESDIDTASVIAAANACDVATAFTTGTTTVTEPRYTCNGVITSNMAREAMLQDLCESMAGWASYGGNWRIQAGSWTPAVMSLTDDDLAGPIEIVQAGEPSAELFNSVRGKYVPAGSAVAAEMEPYSNAVFAAADGRSLWSNIELPHTNSKPRAKNLARVQTEQCRNGLVISYPAKLKAWPLQTGDRVTITSAEYGFEAKLFRVTDWAFGLRSPVNLTLQEDNPEAYDLADATAADPTPNTALPNPWLVPALASLSAASGTAQLQRQGDGTITSRVLVTWPRSTAAYMQDGRIELKWRASGTQAWTQVSASGDDTRAYLTGVRDGDVITIGVTAVNTQRARSPTIWVTHQVVGKSQPPAAVTGLSAVIIPGSLRITWTPCEDIDYAETLLRYGEFWTTAAPLPAIGPASSYEWLWPAPTNYTLWAAHTDTSGNIGEPVNVEIVLGDSIKIDSSLIDPDPDWLNSNQTTADVIALLQDQITTSELSISLRAEVNLISGPASDLASVNGRLGIESDARIAAVSAESRNRLDAEQANANALLRSILADNAGQLSAADSVAIARQELTEQVIAGVSAEAAQRTVLAAKLDTDVSAALAVISLESSARSTAVLAEAAQRNLLATQFRGGYTGTDPAQLTEGLLYQERLVRSGVEDSLAQQITLLSAGSGEQFDWQTIWYFDSGTESWTGNGAPTAAAGFLRPADAAATAYAQSPTGINAEGGKYSQARLRIRKVGSPVFSGWLYWRNVGDTTWDATRRAELSEPSFDTHGIGLVTVNTGWSGAIDRIRIDLSDAQTTGDYYEIDWIAIGRPSPGASSAQLLTEETARTDRDTAITGLVTTLSTQVNDATTGLPATRSTLLLSYSTTANAAAATATAQRALIANYGTTASRVYRQPAAPTQGTQSVTLADGTTATRETLSAGHIWLDSDDGNKPHLWDGSAWVYTPNASGAANQAYLDSLDTALATSAGANTSALRNAVSQVNDPATGLAKTRADVSSLQSTATTDGSAIATEVRTLRAQSQQADETALQNILTGNIAETKFSGSLALAREELTASIVNGISAEATARLSLAAVVGTNAAVLISEGTTRASVDAALSQQLSTLTSTVGTNAATVTTLENSKIGYCTIGGTASDQVQRSTCEAAGGVWHVGLPMAAAVKQVSVSDGTTSATLETRFTAQKTVNGGLLLKAGVKLDNNGYVTGWTMNNDGSSGDMAVLSSAFSVGSPGQSSIVPFIVRTTPITIGNKTLQPGMYVDTAYIGIVSADRIDARSLDILAADGSVIVGAGASAAVSTFAGNASGKVGGVAVATVTAGAAAGTSASNALADATTGLATRLSANAANVLAGPGGLKTGSLVWDTNGNRVSGYGLGITQNGIIAYDSAGTPTITINGITGSVAVAADISGSTGTFAGTVAVGTASSFTVGVGLWASVVSGNPEFRIGNESSFLRWSVAGGLELKQTGIVLRFAVGGDIAHTAYTTYSQEYSLGTKEVQVVSGGTSPYTYAWFLIDRGSDGGGSIFSSGSSSSAIFGLTSRLTQGSFASVWARCVVTDSAGRVASIEFGATSTETH